MILDLKLAMERAVDVPVYFGEADCGIDCVTYSYIDLGTDGTIHNYYILVKSLANSLANAERRLNCIRAAIIDRSGNCRISSRSLKSVTEVEALPTSVDEQNKVVVSAKLLVRGLR